MPSKAPEPVKRHNHYRILWPDGQESGWYPTQDDARRAAEREATVPRPTPEAKPNRLAAVLALWFVACCWLYSIVPRNRVEATNRVTPHAGNPSARGGSATVRRPYDRQEDDPETSNDESNDQPLGNFGTLTLSVCSVQSGNCYTLDADVSGTTLHRIYFPKGGWVDFLACELDDELTGECDDERGRSWEIQGRN